MAESEEYFPRGGKKPTTTYFKQSENFLGGAEKGERKKRKQKKKSEADDGYLSDEVVQEVDQSYKTCGIWLSYKVVKEGQLLLGRVKLVKETSVMVALPCRMQGVVMACHISEAYNKLLEAYVNDQVEKVRELSEMFRPGQYVAVKVVEVRSNILMLSMMPQHVHSARTLADLHKGALLQAAVSSVEDHGFVMDIGIPGTRAFLPKDSANPDVLLDTGVLAWTVIKSLSVESGVVTLSSHLDQLQKAFQRKPAALLPATALDFTVDKPLDNGIEGHVLDRVTAYIQRNHVDMVKGKKPGLGHKIRARLLYVVPPNNIPFLTMRNIFETTYPDLAREQKFDDGDIVDEAQVIKIVGRIVQMKLGEGSIGVLSLRRVTVHEDLTDEQVLLKSYPIGSTHKVRILCYNLLDFVYSVTDDPSVLNEKYFKLSQLSVGKVVEATITTVADNCLYVTVGRVSGHVPQLHMSETGIFVDPKKASHSKLPKKKFKVDQVVTGRVLSMDVHKQRLSLTLKPSLLDPELDILQSYEQAAVGKAYTGVIVNIKDYLLVSFFNNVTAFVPKRLVTSEPLENLSDAFHIGQIVKCTIISVNPEENKMSGSLITPPFTPSDTWSKSVKRKKIDQEFVPNKQKKIEESPTPEDANSPDSTNCEEFVPEKQEEIEEILTAEDISLIDLTNCQTAEQFEDRVVALQKFIRTKKEHRKRIAKKIAVMEEKGLDATNKKRHTEMHAEKLIIQQRIQKLNEALKIGLDKLKQMNVKPSKASKNKKEMDASKIEDKVDDKKEINVKTSKNEKAMKASKIENEVTDKKEKKAKKNVDKIKEVKVLDSLKPVIDVPSAKDFWTLDTGVIADKRKEEESSSSEEEEDEKPKKKRKKLSIAEKVAKAREEEERIREMEKRAIESESAPRSSDQFERALLAQPNCSQLWIAYMAFHLQATEIDKARAVGRKALNTINFREEGEKLNVWLALLNLEHRFGTKESQQKTLEDALQTNDTYEIHSKLLDILVDTSKPQELVSLVELMMRKYRRRVDAYAACGDACFRAALVEKARQVMQKGIAALEKKEHVSLLVRFAQLERAHGDRERSEALFEQVLAVYPQRVDVCSAYVDILLRARDVDRVRQVMERMTSLQLPARKMKVLYKKWIAVEEKIGDEAHAEAVRQRAVQFIDRAKF